MREQEGALLFTRRYRNVPGADANAMYAVCNDVSCVMLVVKHGFKLRRISAHMAATCAETEEFVQRIRYILQRDPCSVKSSVEQTASGW